MRAYLLLRRSAAVSILFWCVSWLRASLANQITQNNPFEHHMVPPVSMSPYIASQARNVSALLGASSGASSPVIGAWLASMSMESTVACFAKSGFTSGALSSLLPQSFDLTSDWNGWLSAGNNVLVYTGDRDGGSSLATSGAYKRNPLSGAWILSVGGSNADFTSWQNKMNNPAAAQNLFNFCKAYGFGGIDFDIEGDSITAPWFDDQLGILIKNLKTLAAQDSAFQSTKFVIQLTILLGSVPVQLLNKYADSYDYVALMPYNGGIFRSGASNSGGCSWDQWSEIFLSSGSACHCNPLGKSCSEYWAPIANVPGLSHKIIIGLPFYGSESGWATPQDVQKAAQLVKQYDGAGLFFWAMCAWPGYTTSLGCKLRSSVAGWSGVDSPYSIACQGLGMASCVPASQCPTCTFGAGGGGGGGGGGGYVPCPAGSWDTGGMSGSSQCGSGSYYKPGDPSWPDSSSAGHWCCAPNGGGSSGTTATTTSGATTIITPTFTPTTSLVPTTTVAPTTATTSTGATGGGSGGYVHCPMGSWDTGILGASNSCASGSYYTPGDPSWPNSSWADHWCCIVGN